MLSINNTTRSIGQLTNCKLQQWNRSAVSNFIIHVKGGGETVRQIWANGVQMVGPSGGHAGQFVPYEQAKAAWVEFRRRTETN